MPVRFAETTPALLLDTVNTALFDPAADGVYATDTLHVCAPDRVTPDVQVFAVMTKSDSLVPEMLAP